MGRNRKSAVAEEVPFEDPSFTADNAQDAIIEAKQNAEGFPRAGLPLISNGTMGNNDLISYSNLTPTAVITFPVRTKINELTFANDRTSVECDLELWKNGVGSGTLIKTVSISTGSETFQAEDLNADNLILEVGDYLQIRYIDQGTNAADLALVLWISRVAEP